jgi:hypothetical protein
MLDIIKARIKKRICYFVSKFITQKACLHMNNDIFPLPLPFLLGRNAKFLNSKSAMNMSELMQKFVYRHVTNLVE